MGVPKFFRYISERYPCLSELVKEYQIPGFDNLYLDMNGIIHMCSHPDDNDPTFRITEEKIMQDVFHYIEVLFRMIKPQKVFFMAVDGVAPRAKMNQQRGRRFRSAREAEKQDNLPKQKPIEMPKTARFDSNCITPGTIFMTKLHEQLKYFVSNKITTDKLWQKCTVILSGHETPGEGEHKIMDYIRYSRSQPGYDPNTRHCLYGLDADLVMLGLVSHEPHFSLLREEVKFGRKSIRRVSPENTTFYLLHLSLMREYLREEFKSVADKISFEYNLESIIDDWVLMGFLVGNDFIPHLPNLHISNGALPLLYKTYIEVIPELDGYLNESGTINLKRFHKFMKLLTQVDYKNFEDTYDDLQYFKSKTGRAPNSKERKCYKPRLGSLPILQELEAWDAEEVDEFTPGCLEPDNASFNKDLAALIRQTDDFVIDDPEEPSITELDKIFLNDEDDAEDRDMQIEMEFQLHKKNYYETKLRLTKLTPDTLIDLSYEYVRALQWILNYYYNGVCSWSWFYPYHYAPYISDIKGFTNMKEDFDLSKPFLPYEQLLAVLPSASKDSLPKPFHSLMTDLDSPIKDFYPDNFETDLNGKRQEWEAVVLIPFIDETRLTNAMALALTHLSPEERARNSHGPMLVYHYSNDDLGSYYAPDYFPTIQVNHALCTTMSRESVYVPRNKLVKGVFVDAAQGVYYPGFPTTKHLEYKSALLKRKVKVFDQPSRDYNLILAIDPPKEIEDPQINAIAAEYLHKTVFVRWPHLIEAKVVAVSNAEYRYDATSDGKGYNVVENLGNIKDNFVSEKSAIEEYYMERRGVDVGPTSFLIHVRELVGRRYEFLNDGKMRVNLAKEYAAVISAYPRQTVVKDINVYDDHRSNYQQLSDLFPDGAMCFMLGHPHYGTTGKVIHCEQTFAKGRVKISTLVADDPNFSSLHRLNDDLLNEYYSQHSAATRLSLSYGTLARITGTVLVGRGASKNLSFEEASKANVGLNLKNARKNEGVPGYVKNIYSKWYYSEKCLQLIDNYRRKFIGLFQFLSSNANGFPFEVEIFPNDKGDGTTLKKIQEWLSEQSHFGIEMQNCDSKVLETEVVQEIESVLPKYYERIKPKQVKMTVRPHVVYIPGIVSGNVSADNSATFELFDRVINVRECYTVPVGHIGTIIAVHKVANDTFADEKKNEVLVDVLYDKAFVGGLSLNGCLPNRGFRMSRNDLINKSHGNRMLNREMEKKTPNYKAYIPEMRPDEAVQSSAFATWNNSHYSNNYNDNHNIPLHVSPQKWTSLIQPTTAYVLNIPTQMQRQPHQSMFTNIEINDSYMDNFSKPQTVVFNAHNIPTYVPPAEAINRERQPNHFNGSENNSKYVTNSNTFSKSPSKASVPNKQGSPSKPPLGRVQRQEESRVKDRQTQGDSPSKERKSENEEVEVKTERRLVNNQPGTEMLRNLLRLNEKENRKIDENLSKVSGSNSVDNFFQMAQSSRTINSETQRPLLNSTQFFSTSSSQQSPTSHQQPQQQQHIKEFPSAQLLSFFISQGMGCPMYTYSHIQGDCKAEVRIPTNQDRNMVVVSDLCGSIDAATQDVAQKTLEQLKFVDLSIFMPEVPPIPNPPKQWCTNNPTSPRNSNQSNSYSRIVQSKPSPKQPENWRTDNRSPIQQTETARRTENISTTNRSVLNAESVSFVPLQVTRKHHGKTSGAGHVEQIIKNNTDHRNKGPTLAKNISPQHKRESVPNFEQVSTSSGQQKPKAARKMRLAANFRHMPT